MTTFDPETLFKCPVCDRIGSRRELAASNHLWCACGKESLLDYEKFIIDSNDYIKRSDINEVKNMDKNFNKITVAADPAASDPETMFTVLTHRPEHQWIKNPVKEVLSPDTPLKIMETCESLAAILIEKNRKYGDSALHPVKIFSKVDATNSLLVRADDKLSRIMNNPELRRDDITDLAGYLILIMIANGWMGYDNNIDMFDEVA